MLNFPSSPTTGQIFSGPKGEWMWNGTVWERYPRMVSPTAGFRNAVINGNFDVFHRTNDAATAFTANTKFFTDRWMVAATGAQSVSAAAQVNNSGQYYTPTWGDSPLSVGGITLANSGTAAADSCIVTQRIENAVTFSGTTATFSLKVWSNVARKFSFYFNQIFGGGGSASVVDMGLTKDIDHPGDGWRAFAYPVVLFSTAGKTIGTNSYLSLNIVLSGGSNYSTYIVGPQPAGTVYLSQIQLETGSNGYATPFERRPRVVEGKMAGRYYEALQSAGAFPMPSAAIWSADFRVFFTTIKRVAPTVTYTQTAGNHNGGSLLQSVTAYPSYIRFQISSSAAVWTNSYTLDNFYATAEL